MSGDRVDEKLLKGISRGLEINKVAEHWNGLFKKLKSGGGGYDQLERGDALSLMAICILFDSSVYSVTTIDFKGFFALASDKINNVRPVDRVDYLRVSNIAGGASNVEYQTVEDSEIQEQVADDWRVADFAESMRDDQKAESELAWALYIPSITEIIYPLWRSETPVVDQHSLMWKDISRGFLPKILTASLKNSEVTQVGFDDEIIKYHALMNNVDLPLEERIKYAKLTRNIYLVSQCITDPEGGNKPVFGEGIAKCFADSNRFLEHPKAEKDSVAEEVPAAIETVKTSDVKLGNDWKNQWLGDISHSVWFKEEVISILSKGCGAGYKTEITSLVGDLAGEEKTPSNAEIDDILYKIFNSAAGNENVQKRIADAVLIKLKLNIVDLKGVNEGEDKENISRLSRSIMSLCLMCDSSRFDDPTQIDSYIKENFKNACDQFHNLDPQYSIPQKTRIIPSPASPPRVAKVESAEIIPLDPVNRQKWQQEFLQEDWFKGVAASVLSKGKYNIDENSVNQELFEALFNSADDSTREVREVVSNAALIDLKLEMRDFKSLRQDVSKEGCGPLLENQLKSKAQEIAALCLICDPSVFPKQSKVEFDVQKYFGYALSVLDGERFEQESKTVSYQEQNPSQKVQDAKVSSKDQLSR
jgi:hypothetical protein